MKMSLDSSGVSAGIDKAKSKISGFAASSIGKLKSIISSGLGPLGAAFGIAGIKRLIDDMTELGRTAARLGVGVESFQRLAYAAQQTGVDTERLADAMKDLDVKLQDGIMRGGSFAELIQELGLDMNELAAMPADQRMLAFADAIQEASGSLSRFGADEFGDAMFELLPLLEMGSDGILKLGESATTMSTEQIAAAERASRSIDGAINDMVARLSIVVAELGMLFEVLITGATQAVIEIGNIFQPLGKLFKGVFTFDTALIGQALNEISTAAEGSLYRVQEAVNATIDEQIAEKHKAQQAQMTAQEIARLKSVADANKKRKDSEEKLATKVGNIDKKIDDERFKRHMAELDTEGKLEAATERRIRLKNELSEIDPFEDIVARGEKELELEKAITEEQKLAAQAQQEADEAAEESDLIQQEATQKRLETELAVALASGDEDAIRLAQEKLDLESAIQDMVNRTGMGYDEAKVKVGAINDQLREEKALQGQLLEAQADQNIELQHELEKQIDLEQKIADIMNSTNKGREEAVALAKKLQAVQAGPDLNQSGIVTPREQKEFDRQQKIRAKEQEQRLRDEIRDERERGGNIRNVSKERRDTGSPRERAEQAREDRKRKQANDRINRERDPERRQALIDAENKRRAGVEPKVGGQPPNGPGGNGPDGKKGPDPKKPEDPAKTTNKKLDEQIGLLKDIKEALKC